MKLENMEIAKEMDEKLKDLKKELRLIEGVSEDSSIKVCIYNNRYTSGEIWIKSSDVRQVYFDYLKKETQKQVDEIIAQIEEL